MRVLVVYCHPSPQSFNAAVRDAALEALAEAGHETRLLDLYEIGFDPVMRRDEHGQYHDESANLAGVADQAEHLLWAEAVVFVYPTWWYGLPAMLKGWLERVLVPGFAFEMPTERRGTRPKLRHIRHVVVLTTCGASPLLTWLMGQPGRRTLLRGFRSVCNPLCRTSYMALYKMDTVSPEARRSHLARVRSRLSGIGRFKGVEAFLGLFGQPGAVPAKAQPTLAVRKRDKT